MSIRASGGTHEQYVHEAVYYDTVDQLVDATAPLLRRALADGEDVALGCSDKHNRALLEALDDDHRVLVLPRSQIYTKAVAAVGYVRDFVQERVTAGAPRVCVLGEVDFGAHHRASHEWRRYEALLDHALSEFPLWSLCGYHTQALGAAELTTADLTHPFVRRGGVQAANPVQVDSGELLRAADAATTVVPRGTPALTIPVLELDELRRQVGAVLGDAEMGVEQVDDLLVALHEVVINSLRHGEPPVTVRLWTPPGRVECTVTDRGPGYDDPFAGYLRGGGDDLPEGRFGLWLARQMCDEVVVGRTAEGFVTRLVIDR